MDEDNTPLSSPTAPFADEGDRVATLENEKAKQLYAARDWRGAVEAYGRAIAARPTATLHTNKAAAAIMLQRYAEAIEDCRAAMALDPACIKAYVRCGKAELALGNFEAAIAMYSSGEAAPAPAAADKDKETARADKAAAQAAYKRFGAAKSALANSEWDTALAALAKLAEPCPAAAVLRTMKVEGLIGAGKLAEALALTTEAIRANGSGNTAVTMLHARVLTLQGHMAKAASILAEVLRSDPDNTAAAKALRAAKKAETLKEAGNAAFKAGRNDDAIKAYSDALELDQRNKVYNSRLLANRAAAQSKAGRHGEAVEDATACLEMDPTYIKGYIRRAQAYLGFKDKDSCEAAVRDYMKAKEVAGGGSPGIAASENLNGEQEEVIRDLEAGLRAAKAELKKVKHKDYYKILELERGCTEDELKKVRRRHPLRPAVPTAPLTPPFPRRRTARRL
jgi:DnaJ family protein C protein 7